MQFINFSILNSYRGHSFSEFWVPSVCKDLSWELVTQERTIQQPRFSSSSRHTWLRSFLDIQAHWCMPGRKQRPVSRTAHWQDLPDFLFPTNVQSVLSGKVPKANVESSKNIPTHRDETPHNSQYPCSAQWHRILTTSDFQLLPRAYITQGFCGTDVWFRPEVAYRPDPTFPITLA